MLLNRFQCNQAWYYSQEFSINAEVFIKNLQIIKKIELSKLRLFKKKTTKLS
jgi:hypothetical protein